MLSCLVTWSVMLLAVPPRLVWHNGHFDNIVILCIILIFCTFLHFFLNNTWETLTFLSGYLALRFVCLDITTRAAKWFRRTSRFLVGVMLSLHSKYLFYSLAFTHGLHSESLLCCSAVWFVHFLFPVSVSLYVPIC